eukprot:TRINITY_DN2677_c0_g1_i9.p1 TRINITY_DN2677_c0_g1~~TRINITY_DN2677_c0_g1_i9.p1  ORF type:complete len:812 (-),score=109.93 TRINITY_DN2677_c0_g1_i9:61-2496(-)
MHQDLSASITPLLQSPDARECGSFASVKDNCTASWFQDGKGYFESCKAAIESAQSEIFITDWILSAEVLLSRPSPEELESEGRSLDPTQLDKHLTLAELLLKKAQDDGVQIRILLFNELEVSLPNNSIYASSQLLAHPNIRVLRHPHGITLWSHHEKLCIVDQAIAYIGGIDLAFGRYDTPEHPISDPDGRFVPGKDLYNPRVAGFEQLQNPHEDLFDRERYPRMPWHDISFCVAGAAARDAAQHFLQRWNNHSKDFRVSTDVCELEENLINASPETRRRCAERANNSTLGLTRDYGFNQNLEDCCFVSRSHMRCCGTCFTASRDKLNCCGNASKQKTDCEILMLDEQVPVAQLVPGLSDSSCHAVRAQVLRSASDWSVGCESVGGSWYENSVHQAYLHEIMNAEKFIYIENQFFISSTANPSIDTDGDGTVDLGEEISAEFGEALGTDTIQNQIAEALARRIERAVKAKALFESGTEFAELDATDDGTFRVVIVIPNFPEGAVTDIAVQAVLHYTLMTLVGVPVPEQELIYRKDSEDRRVVGSLITRVQAACGKHLGDESRWIEYITVNCLRNHAVINGIPLMNQIYVHSKLMIVDDRTCICGSANINERSQLGPRDSEVCYRILPQHGKGDLQIKMNGEPHTASSFAHSLRRSLWAEHLGMKDVLASTRCRFEDDDLGDPVCEKNFMGNWRRIAEENTQVCNKYFPEQPANHHVDLKVYSMYREVADTRISNSSKAHQVACHKVQEYQLQNRPDAENIPSLGVLCDALARFQGHLYQYPLKFLQHDLDAGRLKPSLTDAEGVIPAKTFT